jgi:hypothetical protein
MPAAITDIDAASRDVATATWTDAGVAGRYANARDGAGTPADGYFDILSDAAAVVVARGALIGTERRRFAVSVDQVIWPSVAFGLPQVRLVDAEQSVNAGCLAARIEVDLDAETTSYELFG